MKKLNIALLSGGDSSEREIALASAAQIEQAMDHSKYDITVVDVQGRNWTHTTANGEVIAVDKNDFSIFSWFKIFKLGHCEYHSLVCPIR